MRLARIGDRGSEKPAIVTDDGVAHDLSGVVDEIGGEMLSEGALDRIRDVDPHSLPPIDGRLGSCIARPGMVLCVGFNYEDHVRETGGTIPTEPILFQKATNTVVGPNDDLIIPKGSSKTDWEVELGVVVGRRASYLADEDAGWEAIAGYAVCNDVSEREFQLERGGQWSKGKSAATFNPTGPWLVTADEVSDPMNLELKTTVNDEITQSGNTGTMIFNPGHLVWYASQFMVLEPGDLINTGTPPGVGMFRDPPLFLREGDLVTLTIEGLGTQRQRCVSA